MHHALRVGKLFEALDAVVATVATLTDPAKGHISIREMIHDLIGDEGAT